MTNITVRGLPGEVTLYKLVFSLRKALKTHKYNKFWIRELSDIYGSDTKQAKIEFSDPEEARKAKDRLNRIPLDCMGKIYHLSADMEYDGVVREPSPYNYRRRSPSPYYQRPCYEDDDLFGSSSRDRYYTGGRDRSRSPLYNESSKLDIEIEMLRKQRLILEEERKLILERKRLELVKEFGPSAHKEFDYFDGGRDRSRDRSLRAHRETRPLSRPFRDEHGSQRYRRSPRRTREPRFPTKHSSNSFHTIPMFRVPCKILLKQMEKLFSECTTKETLILEKLIRSTLRKRIAVALEGKPHMIAPKIVELYRSLYPESTDAALVNRALGKIRDGHIQIEEKEDKTVKENTTERETGSPDGNLNESAEEVALEEADDPDGVALRNECALSLDATEIEDAETAAAGNEEWAEISTDWMEETEPI